MIVLASVGLVSLFVVLTFLEQMEDLTNDYTAFAALRYVTYSIPRFYYDTLPFAVLIGCLTGLGSLSSSSELIVMRSAGISTWQIFWSATKPAVVLIVLGVLVGELVLPDFERMARVTREKDMSDDITPRGGFWYRESDIYMHFNTISDNGGLEDINQYYMDADRSLIQSRWVESATYQEEEGAGYWLLNNVVVTHHSSVDNPVETIEHIDQVVWRTELTPQILNTEILVQPNKMSMLELYRKIDYMQAQGLNTDKFELGLWSKLLQPIASLSLVFVAVSFIFGPLRGTTMGLRVVTGLIVGILFKFVQDLLSPASLVFGFSPVIATLIPILICIWLGTYLMRRAH